ncbi:MAG: 50S ribosomal protein L3 [Thermodesulfobacteriota bacterium]
MCKGILGRKLGMTGMFSNDGRYVPITVVEAGPCVVTQIKTVATDGYDALQLGFVEKKPGKVNKPLAGHFKKSGGRAFRHLGEFSVDDPQGYSLGQTLSPLLFSVGERVNVTGITKGRGFSGVVRRHGFGGGRKTHGGHCHRLPGSIGCSAWPSRVTRGKRMPGRFGNTRNTTRSLEIFDIREEENLILIKGAVPGAKNGLVQIRKVS